MKHIRGSMITWKKMSDDSYQYDLGNNLYIVIKPVMVYCQNRGNGFAVGKYKERRMFSPEVIAGNFDDTLSVRKWGGGGDGHGNYRTLSEAKAAGIQEAGYVAQGIVNQLQLLKSRINNVI